MLAISSSFSAIPMSWFRVHRGWMNSHDFAKEPFTEREAWLWIVENAAYEPHKRYVSGEGIDLARGQLIASQRNLSEAWKWGRQRVRGFLAKLEHVGSLTQNSTHGLTMLTVCNYERYQGEQPNFQPSSNPAATQQQPIKEEGKEIKKGKEDTAGADYAFVGSVIRLKRDQWEKWKSAYRRIDLRSAIQSRDDWLASEADEPTRKKWFLSTSNYLRNLNQQASSRSNDDWEMPC